MQQRNYLEKWKLLLVLTLLTSSLTGCASFLGGSKPAPEPIVVTKTELVYREIPIQPKPKPVTLYDIQFYAVTKENINEFIERFEKAEGALLFFPISLPD